MIRCLGPFRRRHQGHADVTGLSAQSLGCSCSAQAPAGNTAAIWKPQKAEDWVSLPPESAMSSSNGLVYFRGKEISAAQRHGLRVPNGCAKGSDWQTPHKIIIA